MSTAREVLAAVQQRADAATDGPWEHRLRTRSVIRTTGFATAFGVVDGAVAVTSSVPDDDDAEFIAASRTDVPRLVAALTAALDVHKRGECYPSAGYDGTVPTDDDRLDDACQHCEVEWPCPTVAAITAALTPKENDRGLPLAGRPHRLGQLHLHRRR